MRSTGQSILSSQPGLYYPSVEAANTRYVSSQNIHHHLAAFVSSSGEMSSKGCASSASLSVWDLLRSPATGNTTTTAKTGGVHMVNTDRQTNQPADKQKGLTNPIRSVVSSSTALTVDAGRVVTATHADSTSSVFAMGVQTEREVCYCLVEVALLSFTMAVTL